jgi:hypothetical protein
LIESRGLSKHYREFSIQRQLPHREIACEVFFTNITTETLVTPLLTQHDIPDNKITGKTTFQDLLDWGVPVEVIQKIIGGDLPSPATVIKDYLTQEGLEFSPIKTALQTEVDKIK